MGPGVKEAHTPPQLPLHLLWSLVSVQQPGSVQERQAPPAKLSAGPATTLGDGGAANPDVEDLAAQDGVGGGAFPAASFPQQNQSVLGGGGKLLPA